MAYRKYDSESKNAQIGSEGERRFEEWFSVHALPVQLIRTRPLIMAWLGLPEDHVRVSTFESQFGDYLIVKDGRAIARVEVSTSDRDTKYVTLGERKLKNFDGDYHALVDLRRDTVCMVHRGMVDKYVANQDHDGYRLVPSMPFSRIEPRETFY
jgi:hypothetical protein